MSLQAPAFTPLSANPQEGRSTIALRVYRQLREAIVSLRLLPGNSLSEAEVAKQMGTSRQPVREAFIKLSEAGLVQVRPQRGQKSASVLIVRKIPHFGSPLPVFPPFM